MENWQSALMAGAGAIALLALQQIGAPVWFLVLTALLMLCAGLFLHWFVQTRAGRLIGAAGLATYGAVAMIVLIPVAPPAANQQVQRPQEAEKPSTKPEQEIPKPEEKVSPTPPPVSRERSQVSNQPDMVIFPKPSNSFSPFPVVFVGKNGLKDVRSADLKCWFGRVVVQEAGTYENNSIAQELIDRISPGEDWQWECPFLATAPEKYRVLEAVVTLNIEYSMPEVPGRHTFRRTFKLVNDDRRWRWELAPTFKGPLPAVGHLAKP